MSRLLSSLASTVTQSRLFGSPSQPVYGSFSGHGGGYCCEDDRLFELLAIGIALMALMAAMSGGSRKRRDLSQHKENKDNYWSSITNFVWAGEFNIVIKYKYKDLDAIHVTKNIDSLSFGKRNWILLINKPYKNFTCTVQYCSYK